MGKGRSGREYKALPPLKQYIRDLKSLEYKQAGHICLLKEKGSNGVFPFPIFSILFIPSFISSAIYLLASPLIKQLKKSSDFSDLPTTLTQIKL